MVKEATDDRVLLVMWWYAANAAVPDRCVCRVDYIAIERRARYACLFVLASPCELRIDGDVHFGVHFGA